MILAFCATPLLCVESTFAGRAAELRLTILAYQFGLILLVGDIS